MNPQIEELQILYGGAWALLIACSVFLIVGLIQIFFNKMDREFYETGAPPMIPKPEGERPRLRPLK